VFIFFKEDEEINGKYGKKSICPNNELN